MIDCQNITKKFDNYTVLENFTYSFSPSHSYALTGRSGSGKTTLLNLIGKLESPDEGEIFINDKPLTSIKEKDYFKNYISYLFQNYGLIDHQTIYENLDLAFVGKKLLKSEKRELMKETLRAVNLSLNLDRKIFSLSGGEAQRIAIAKIMLKDSPIILADEPTASLDEKNSIEVMDLLLGLKEKGKLLIVATHDSTVIHRLDKVIDLNRRKNNEIQFK